MNLDQIQSLRSLTVVTPPDDVLIPSKRILLVNLTAEQTGIISNALLTSENQDPAVIYVWQSGQCSDWVLDKKIKSNLIVFDANAEDCLITGIMACDTKAHYFGTLFNYRSINTNAIVDIAKLKKLL
jgi:hypothetical protein